MSVKHSSDVRSEPVAAGKATTRQVLISPEEGPNFAMRLFTIQPGGEIPIHNHFYHQTMYILSGRVECYQYDPQTEEAIQTKVTESGDFIYVPSMETHGMKNIGDEPVTFLCCIANIYEDEE